MYPIQNQVEQTAGNINIRIGNTITCWLLVDKNVLICLDWPRDEWNTVCNQDYFWRPLSAFVSKAWSIRGRNPYFATWSQYETCQTALVYRYVNIAWNSPRGKIDGGKTECQRIKYQIIFLYFVWAISTWFGILFGSSKHDSELCQKWEVFRLALGWVSALWIFMK